MDYEFVSYEEFEKVQLEEKQYRLEYDNGYIYYMSPVFPNHDRVKNEIAFAVREFVKKEGKCEVFTSYVAVVFESKNEKFESLPDIMVCCDQNKFQGAKYKGIPSFVVEILSHSTEHRDKEEKLQVYEKFGVPEYWTVNLKDNTITVYSNNVKGKYLSINSYTSGMTISCLINLKLKVDEIFSVMK